MFGNVGKYERFDDFKNNHFDPLFNLRKDQLN